MRLRMVGWIVVGLTFAGAAFGEEARARDEQGLRAAAAQVVEALAEKDFGRLADLVDPEKGVLFSPYTLVAPKEHVTLTPGDLRELAGGKRMGRGSPHLGTPLGGLSVLRPTTAAGARPSPERPSSHA